MWYWLPGVVLALIIFIYKLGESRGEKKFIARWATPPEWWKEARTPLGTQTGRITGTRPNHENVPKSGESTELPQGW